MMITNKIALSVLTATLLTFTGCGSSEEGTTASATPKVETPTVKDSTTSTTPSTTVAPSELTGDITSDTILRASTQYRIKGLVKVKNGSTLTIEPGTVIYGEAKADFLVITKGSKIMAEGTSANPIIFTSKKALDDSSKADSGQWGGLTLLGEAPTNHDNPFYEVDESDADFAFGGNQAADNSGILKYVQILNSGAEVATDQEINGLSLAGVGSGTTIDEIVVTNSGDDCVEIWGGTVNVSNISMTNCLDDSFDLDYGYVGTATNITVVQTEAAHAGFEISSGGTSPMTSPTIKNFTITKVAGSDEGGIYIKDDTTAPTFIDGTVTTTSVADAEGAIRAKKVMSANQKSTLAFKNVTLNADVKYFGAGASDAQDRHTANDAN